MGAIISNTNITLLRRVNSKTSSKSVEFTDTFPLDSTNPTARTLLLYLAYLACDAATIDPALWPDDSPNQKWVKSAEMAVHNAEGSASQ